MWNGRWWFALVAAWGWLIMAPASGLGSGFALYEAGARSSALACAVVARADDLSAIFFNPAGLVQLPGFQVMGGFSFIIPRVEIVTQSGGVDTRTLMDSQVSTVPHFFSSYQVARPGVAGVGGQLAFRTGDQV